MQKTAKHIQKRYFTHFLTLTFNYSPNFQTIYRLTLTKKNRTYTFYIKQLKTNNKIAFNQHKQT